MFARLKAIGAVMAVAGGYAIYHNHDLETNYTRVEAHVAKADFQCTIEARRSKLVEKDTKKKAYVDCAAAPEIAKQFGYKESDIRVHAKLTYRYTSPADGKMHNADYEGLVGSMDSYKQGKAIKIYAHNTEAETTSWN